MTTQINITVDSGGLSERAKQQQQAARQAQLEKERTLNLSAEALDKRVAAQAAKGQSLNGQPLYTAGFKQPQVERRPAANRASSETVILTPLAAPLGTNIISPLTIPANESVIADPNSLRYKEKFGNFFLVGPAYGGGATTVLPTDPGLFSDFGPSLGKNSIRITDDSPSVSISAFKYHSIAAQTLGGRKKMPVGSNAPFTVEAWLYVPQVDADTTGFFNHNNE
ncbi:MAG: hypothetical protein RJA11_618 [Bacteroidota bacterium]